MGGQESEKSPRNGPRPSAAAPRRPGQAAPQEITRPVTAAHAGIGPKPNRHRDAVAPVKQLSTIVFMASPAKKRSEPKADRTAKRSAPKGTGGAKRCKGARPRDGPSPEVVGMKGSSLQKLGGSASSGIGQAILANRCVEVRWLALCLLGTTASRLRAWSGLCWK